MIGNQLRSGFHNPVELTRCGGSRSHPGGGAGIGGNGGLADPTAFLQSSAGKDPVGLAWLGGKSDAVLAGGIELIA